MIRILLVDDDDLSRGAIQKMLERGGYAVESTRDGDEVIRMYGKQGADLVITDLIMPDKDGLEIIEDLRKLNPKVRILAISGGGIHARPDRHAESSRRSWCGNRNLGWEAPEAGLEPATR